MFFFSWRGGLKVRMVIEFIVGEGVYVAEGVVKVNITK